MWRVENLVNLVNRLQFTKLNPPYKVVATINNPLADLFTHQAFFRQMFKKSEFTKLSHYMVGVLFVIQMDMWLC